MKTKLFFLLALLVSCSSEQEKLIESYVSIIDGVRSELKFKAISTVEGEPVTSVDSMVFMIYDQIPIKFTVNSDSVNLILLNESGSQYDMVFKKSQIDNLISLNQKMISLETKRINRADSMIKELNLSLRTKYNPYIDYTGYISRFRETISEAKESLIKEQEKMKNLELARKYSLMPDKTVLLKSFVCTYSIFNPMLQVKQTLTQKFYFDSDLTKVIASSDAKQ